MEDASLVFIPVEKVEENEGWGHMKGYGLLRAAAGAAVS